MKRTRRAGALNRPLCAIVLCSRGCSAVSLRGRNDQAIPAPRVGRRRHREDALRRYDAMHADELAMALVGRAIGGHLAGQGVCLCD